MSAAIGQPVGQIRPSAGPHAAADSSADRTARVWLSTVLRAPGPGAAVGLAAPALAISFAGVPITISTAVAGIAYLVVRSTGPDLTDRQIPRDACWHAAFFGVVAGTAALFLGPSLSAPQLLGTLPVTLALLTVLTVSWWVGRGGFGDVRLVVAYITLTCWWITPGSLLVGLALAIANAIGAALTLRSAVIPAGPALSALFAGAAVVTLLVPSL